MYAFNTLLRAPPTYAEGTSAMVAGVPFYGILARFCNTPAGYNMFTNPGVNLRFHKMFSKWEKLLESPESRSVLHKNKGGWLSKEALESAVVYAGGPQDSQEFPNYYVCDTEDPHYGFTSYDAYFARELKASKRAVVEPNKNSIVNSPCSAEVYKLYSPLKELEKFWLKKTPYSLRHMLGEHEFTNKFVDGTLVQAMLGSRDYHRWRSPINGTVKDTRVIPGTYYAARLQRPPSADPDPDPIPVPPIYCHHPPHCHPPPQCTSTPRYCHHAPNCHPPPLCQPPPFVSYCNCPCLCPPLHPENPNLDPDPVSRSQDFVTAISTRALIFIEADDKDLGLVCFVGVGLGEVSTCNIIVQKDQKLKKGEEIGQFHFGGSTFCLLFEPGVTVTPLEQPDPKDPSKTIPLVGSKVRVGKDMLGVKKKSG